MNSELKLKQDVCASCGFDKPEYVLSGAENGGCDCCRVERGVGIGSNGLSGYEYGSGSVMARSSGSGKVDALRLIESQMTYEDFLTELVMTEKTQWY